MALNKFLLVKLRQRDATGCWHCGEDRIDNLVPHHRRNRGAGGRGKNLDHYQNLILVCPEYNGAMESLADVANLAREYRHKLSQWGTFDDPVFDVAQNRWYKLTVEGTKVAVEEVNTFF